MNLKILVTGFILLLLTTLVGCATSAPAWIVVPNSNPEAQHARFIQEGWEADLLQTPTEDLIIVYGFLYPFDWNTLAQDADATVHLAFVVYFATVAEAEAYETQLKNNIHNNRPFVGIAGVYYVVSRHDDLVSLYVRATDTVANLSTFNIIQLAPPS